MKPVVHQNTLPVKIVDQVKEYLKNEFAENTRKSYGYHLTCFASFCVEHKYSPLPATPDTLIHYITELASTKKVATLSAHLSAIKKVHEEKELDSPTDHIKVKRLMKGIKNTKGVKPKQAKAIRKNTLNKVVLPIDDNSIIGLRDRTLLLWGFIGAYRRSELAATRMEDLTFDEKGITVFIPRSKKDQQGQGQYKVIPYHSRPELCPVRTFMKYQKAVGISEGFVFVSPRKGDRPQYDKPIPSKSIYDIFKPYLKGGNYVPHSLRAGFITEAKRAGSDDYAICNQTGQKVATIQTYVRPINAWDHNAVFDIQ